MDSLDLGSRGAWSLELPRITPSGSVLAVREHLIHDDSIDVGTGVLCMLGMFMQMHLMTEFTMGLVTRH
jgi:hypothetical protein